jgi:hypothetical protein
MRAKTSSLSLEQYVLAAPCWIRYLDSYLKLRILLNSQVRFCRNQHDWEIQVYEHHSK